MIFLACHKSDLLPLKKKTAFLVTFDIKNGFYDSFPFQNVYFYIHYSNSLKVTALHMFLKKIGLTPSLL